MKINKTLLTAPLLAAGLLWCNVIPVMADGMWDCTTSRNEDGDIVLTFEELEVLLPASWSGKCRMVTSDESVSFYDIKSRDLWTKELGYPNGGWLFSIMCDDNFDYLETPSYQTIGSGDLGNYYFLFPTDVQSYYEDADAVNEYGNMAVQVTWITENVTVNGEHAAVRNNESIFPQSSSEYMDAAQLEPYTADQIQMGINEIYARHHRRFAMKEVQDYFDGCSWYTGYVEPEDFDVNVMNLYESANIQLMVKCMDAKNAQ